MDYKPARHLELTPHPENFIVGFVMAGATKTIFRRRIEA